MLADPISLMGQEWTSHNVRGMEAAAQEKASAAKSRLLVVAIIEVYLARFHTLSDFMPLAVAGLLIVS
jgi:hypothetical protein